MSDPLSDPLAEVVAQLKPAPSISKIVEAAGDWMVRRQDLGSPFYCAIVEGESILAIDGKDPILLSAGDFVLVPEIDAFTMSNVGHPSGNTPCLPLEVGPGTFRIGATDRPAEIRSLVGHCSFDAAPNRGLLLALLPDVIHVRGAARLTALVHMIHDETRADRMARTMMLGRMLEMLLIEALRSAPPVNSAPGLLRGLADPHLAPALRMIHADPAAPLPVSTLARYAAMSRSAFFDRFRREIGTAPKEYVTAWRMTLAKDMLARSGVTNAEIAQRIGYGSASAFCMAFARHVGMSPGLYAQKFRRAAIA